MDQKIHPIRHFVMEVDEHPVMRLQLHHNYWANRGAERQWLTVNDPRLVPAVPAPAIQEQLCLIAA